MRLGISYRHSKGNGADTKKDRNYGGNSMELVMHHKNAVAASHKGLGAAFLFTGFVFEAILMSGAVVGVPAIILASFPLLVFAGTLLALD